MYEEKHLTLLEALEIIKRRKAKSTIEFPVFFASGFTPLHLLSFTQAYLQASSPEETIIIKSGLFNDLFGNIEIPKKDEFRHLLIVVEWQIWTLGWGFDQIPVGHFRWWKTSSRP